ncbi:MAG: aminotransferase class IV, partial [Pseudomonadales bacterium]
MDIVYLNGEYLAADKAVVSVFDRGFLFADSVYEVIPFYRGVGFQLEQHLSRLEYSLAQLRIEAAMPWRQICEGLVERNGSGDLSVYLQITRGAAQGRNHAIDTKLAPTVFACCRPIHDNYSCSVDEIVPISVIVTEDLRWKRCDIKATTLLPNILAQQQAA